MNHREQVIQLIATQYNIDPTAISEEHTLADDLGGDSLDFIELLMGVEHKFSIEVTDAQWEHVVTVDDVVQLVGGLV